MNKYLFKILIAGNSRKQRDQLLNQVQNGLNICDTGNIIGTSFAYYRFNLPNAEATVALQIWDFDEQERFRLIAPDLCNGAMGAMLFFDCCHKDSMNHLHEWAKIFRSNQSEIPIILCGMCCKEYVNHQELCDSCLIDQFLKKYSLNAYIELDKSQKSSIQNAFIVLSEMMIDHQFGMPY